MAKGLQEWGVRVKFWRRLSRETSYSRIQVTRRAMPIDISKRQWCINNVKWWVLKERKSSDTLQAGFDTLQAGFECNHGDITMKPNETYKPLGFSYWPPIPGTPFGRLYNLRETELSWRMCCWGIGREIYSWVFLFFVCFLTCRCEQQSQGTRATAKSHLTAMLDGTFKWRGRKAFALWVAFLLRRQQSGN